METKTGKLISDHRISLNITQTQLGKKLGWKSGQFISNIERNISNLPAAKAKKACRLLSIKKRDMKEALIADYINKVSSFFK